MKLLLTAAIASAILILTGCQSTLGGKGAATAQCPYCLHEGQPASMKAAEYETTVCPSCVRKSRTMWAYEEKAPRKVQSCSHCRVSVATCPACAGN